MDVSILTNGDILLFEDFGYVLEKIQKQFQNEDWMAVAARRNVQKVPEMELIENLERRWSWNRRRRGKKGYVKVGMFTRVRDNETLHSYGGIEVWAWNAGGGRLFDREIPGFVLVEHNMKIGLRIKLLWQGEQQL